MEQDYKLPLSTAILINLNIMLSAGVFLNTITLAQFAGALSPLAYLTVGLLMLPIILCMARLTTIYPNGSFYIYGAKQLWPVAGFLSSWGYFTGKLASSSIMIHFSALLIKSGIPLFNATNPFYIDLFIIGTFVYLNSLQLKASSKIQFGFAFLKSIPILFVILSGLLFFSTSNFEPQLILWDGFPLALPFVVYAFVGFEASCSLSKHIENASENSSKAILYSFALALFLTIVYQLGFFGSVGRYLMSAKNYFNSFPILLKTLFSQEIMNKTKALPQLAIAASALGGSYGIFFSNQWNLYELAMHNYTFFSDSLTKFNKHKIPTLCIIVEALICIFYIYFFSGSNIILQQIAALSCLLAYSVSIIALLKTNRSINEIAAILSSIILIGFTLFGLLKSSLIGLSIFGGILSLGLIMFLFKRSQTPTF